MSKKSRYAKIERKTSETFVRAELVLDGAGSGNINTTIPFVDHMLDLLAKHGLFDLTVEAKGDTEIDHHHTCLLYTSPSPRDLSTSRMPSSA